MRRVLFFAFALMLTAAASDKVAPFPLSFETDPSSLTPLPDLREFQRANPRSEEMSGTYRLRGSRELRPEAISDDGMKTYIEWGRYQSLPAVFGVGPSGNEEVVDGYMRDDVFTIDRVYEHLVFRLDREEAFARRRQRLNRQGEGP